MVRNLKVHKVNQPVDLSFDEGGLRIEGDLNAAKTSKDSKTVCCIPIPAGKGPDPTLLPIDLVYIINAYYLERTNAIEIHCVLPEDRTVDESPADLYKFIYTVRDGERKEAEEFCKNLLQEAYRDVTYGKRLLVLINPFSGQGKAKELFEYNVRPIFTSAECVMDIKYTEHQGHALQIGKDLDIQKYDAVVTVSGDGLVHEIMNGFMKRTDASDALKKVSMGLIPCGTNNSFIISCLGEKRGFDPNFAALQIVKGKSMAVDLCSVVYDDHRYFSFLSQNYGATAYADLGTESLRWMGDARTIVGLLSEIFARNTYYIQAAVQVIDSNKETIRDNYKRTVDNEAWLPQNELEGSIVDTIPDLSEPVPDDWKVIEGDISFFLTSKVPLLARGMLSHPFALPNDGAIDLIMVRGGQSISKQLDVFNKVEKGHHINNDIVDYMKIKAFRLTPIIKPGRKSFLAIDGEHAPCKAFQVQVHPRLLSVLSINPGYINTTAVL